MLHLTDAKLWFLPQLPPAKKSPVGMGKSWKKTTNTSKEKCKPGWSWKVMKFVINSIKKKTELSKNERECKNFSENFDMTRAMATC
jgi:hypothetical protein